MKKCLIFLVAALVALFTIATAEELPGIAGTWVPVSIKGDSEILKQIQVPSQLGLALPELCIYEDGTICVNEDNNSVKTGTYKKGAEENELCVEWNDGPSEIIKISDRRLCLESVGESGKIIANLAPKDETDPVGVWKPILQTAGQGEYWNIPVNTETVELSRDGVVSFSSDDEPENQIGKWNQTGNDIIIWVSVETEENEENYIPYRYYQLENGLLKQYSIRNKNDIFTIVYSKTDNVSIEEVDSIRPLLNTAWELVAKEINGAIIPLSMYGDTTEEYIAFLNKANGRLIHTQKENNTVLKFNCYLQDRSLELVFKDGTKVLCHFAGEGYLVRDINDAERLYYRRKMIPDAPGVADDENTPIDFVIQCPVTTLTAGENTAFTVKFNDPDLINNEKGNDQIIWSANSPTGEEIQGVSIGKDGVLQTDATIEETTEVMIQAKSVLFGTTANMMINITPAK